MWSGKAERPTKIDGCVRIAVLGTVFRTGESRERKRGFGGTYPFVQLMLVWCIKQTGFGVYEWVDKWMRVRPGRHRGPLELGSPQPCVEDRTSVVGHGTCVSQDRRDDEIGDGKEKTSPLTGVTRSLG